MSAPQLISSQRYLNTLKVQQKAATFAVFIVRVLDVTLRGQRYRVMLDGHHNFAAAKLRGVEPQWRGAPRKFLRIMKSMSAQDFERFLINNLTDSDWFFIETGEVVQELLGVEVDQKQNKGSAQ